MRLVYSANVSVAGTVGALALFAPTLAARTVFSGVASADPAMRVLGAFWLTVAVLSLAGLPFPERFAVVLVVQLF